MNFKITEDEITDLFIKMSKHFIPYITDTGFIMTDFDEKYEIEINENQYMFLNYIKKELEKNDS